ncbi:hypothetical protein ACFPRL_12735 [Pseudoclavibacter helvolus]
MVGRDPHPGRRRPSDRSSWPGRHLRGRAGHRGRRGGIGRS